MSTKVLSDGEVHSYFNPFDSPYDAYINYMNILSDFIIRLNASVPENAKDKEIATLAAIIFEKNRQLEKYEKELTILQGSKNKTSTKVKAVKTVAKKKPTSAIKAKSPLKGKVTNKKKPSPAKGSPSAVVVKKTVKK